MQPILRPAELQAFKNMQLRGWRTKTLDATWPAAEGAAGLEAALARVCKEATAAIEEGYQFLVLSDRAQGARCFVLACSSSFCSCPHSDAGKPPRAAHAQPSSRVNPTFGVALHET